MDYFDLACILEDAGAAEVGLDGCSDGGEGCAGGQVGEGQVESGVAGGG